jgi:hypothetical protein
MDTRTREEVEKVICSGSPINHRVKVASLAI